VGFSSGMLEVDSILGNGDDLVYQQLFSSHRPQYQKTISQIKNIKLRNISILGRIN